MFGMVRNVLGNMVVKRSEITKEFNDITKAQFVLAVCNGLGANLSYEDRAELNR